MIWEIFCDFSPPNQSTAQYIQKGTIYFRHTEFGQKAQVFFVFTSKRWQKCAGFDWVNFLHSSWYGAMFWICAENSADTQRCFSSCWAVLNQSQGLFCFSSHQWGGWGCTRGWEGTQPGQLTPTDQRDIPDHVVSCSAYKAGGRRRRGVDVQSDGVCLPK